MQTAKTKIPKRRPAIFILIPTLVSIALFIVVPLLTFMDNHRSYPLGDKLQYIGRTDYGCAFFCDQAPGSNYYYATDMSRDEIVNYFRKATSNKNDIGTAASEPQYIQLKDSSSSVHLTIYKSHPALDHQVSQARGRYYLLIPSYDYQAAKLLL